MDAQAWWRQPLRIIQPNLQVKDTRFIDPERLAGQLKEMGANTVVFNVGGIYAWYRSEIPFHHVNEYLPKDKDLLEEVIAAFHKEGLKFVARVDFSKADDAVYQMRPEWFVRNGDGHPQIIGAQRPGSWSLLMSTCINAGYRNEEVAAPVLTEALGRYAIDGVFFNNPGTIPCQCGRCRDKYFDIFGSPMPERSQDYDRSWGSLCLKHNMELLNGVIKETRPDVPVISYYNLFNERLDDRKAAADLLCTEPQNVLSQGHRQIPEFWKPALSIKLGRSRSGAAAPLGIVHSCPGMDWRHTGLPPADYAFWLAQIPAYGGQIWHSLTGVPDTIRDKRIVKTVTHFNKQVAKIEQEMQGANSLADVALLWSARPSTEGWADGLINRQIPFDILPEEQAGLETLLRYKAVIVPEQYPIGTEEVARWREYVNRGGHLIVEGMLHSAVRGELCELLGVLPALTVSEPLAASYLRFEGTGNPLQTGLEDTELIAHRGRVVYCKPAAGSAVLATLVPPFSPLESVGAPPERASLSVERTDIPLAVHRRAGGGGVLYLPFSLSGLLNDFKLGEHYQLLDNAIDLVLNGDRLIRMTPVTGLQVALYRNKEGLLLHLVNGAGRRPLTGAIPLYQIEAALPLAALQGSASSVSGLLEAGNLPFRIEEDVVRFTVPKLDVWEVVKIVKQKE
ncbi:alpha-amylase family protein [Paenibacillus arenilitoris]|nr:alpha-amylase family protein [Paenibacillus arenilitoris]